MPSGRTSRHRRVFGTPMPDAVAPGCRTPPNARSIPCRASFGSFQACRCTLSYFTERHSRSTLTLSRHRPLPSMLIATSAARRTSRKLSLVYCETLIRIEDGRLAVAHQSLLQCFHAEARVQTVGQPPRQHLTAVPVDHRSQVHISPTHRNVRDVRSPHFVASHDLTIPQQIRILLMSPARYARSRLRTNRLQMHLPHPITDATDTRFQSLLAQFHLHAPLAVERMLFVNARDRIPKSAVRHRPGTE